MRNRRSVFPEFASLIDTFGKNITFEENNDKNYTYTCSVTVPIYEMEHFAMQNWDMITVTSPDYLVRKLRLHAEKLLKKYEAAQ